MTSICSVILAFMLSIGGGANLSVHLSEKPHPGLEIETRELRPIQTELNQEQQPVLRFFIRNSRLGVRFLQTDPMGYEDSLNLYQAFNQNPVNFVDPFGAISGHADEFNVMVRGGMSVKEAGYYNSIVRKKGARVSEGGLNMILSGIYWLVDLASYLNPFYANQDVTPFRWRFDFSGDRPIIDHYIHYRTPTEKFTDTTIIKPTGEFIGDFSANLYLGYFDPYVRNTEVGIDARDEVDRGMIPMFALAYGGYKYAKRRISSPKRSVVYPEDSITFKGEIYRYEFPEYMDTTWKPTKRDFNIKANHRYSRPGQGALYTSTDALTAFKEVRGNPGKWLTFKKVKVKGLLDLTNPKIRNAYGVTLKDIASKGKYEFTQFLGDTVRIRYRGLLAPSAQNPGGFNLVLFNDL